MATQNSLELSDEEFMAQSASLLAAASAADAASGSAAGTQDGNGKGDDDAEAERLAQEEEARQAEADEQAAAAQAATENQDGQGTEPSADAVASGAGEGADDQDQGKTNKGETDDGSDGDGTGDDDSGKQERARGADGKFTKATDDKNTKDGEQDPSRKDQQQSAATIDFKAEYEKLTAPFKANGRDIKVESVDEAIRLMQMGANYNRKMAALKPNLAIMKSLEQNGLLSQDKINFLIDLDKKNPEAISKLIKDSGIDPLDISADKAGEYKPGNHGVADVEVELDHVLDDLKDAPKYAETLDVVGKQWDVKSRQQIANQPNLIRVINGHMQSGVYDMVATEMERKRLFGGLQGLSDLEAYQQVGDTMASEGKFDHMQKKAGQPTTAGQQAPGAKTEVKPALKKADDSKREEQRRAAAPTKGAAPSGKLPADFNPLSLSDEEFAKFKPNF
jgi:hypothetical protein